MYSKDDLIAALQLRYDAYSAGAVFEISRQRAELADKATYDATELRALRAAIESSGDRVGRVLSELDDMLASAPAVAAPADKPRKEAKAKAVEPVVAEPAKATANEPAEPAKEPAEPAVVAAGAIETTIVLAGLETDDDEEVLLCGASDLLGDWDPERARPMAREGKHWLAQVTLPPDAELAFKFLLRTADGEVSWEPGDDRKLVAKPRIEVTWR